jgi:hypothetical protein
MQTDIGYGDRTVTGGIGLASAGDCSLVKVHMKQVHRFSLDPVAMMLSPIFHLVKYWTSHSNDLSRPPFTCMSIVFEKI